MKSKKLTAKQVRERFGKKHFSCDGSIELINGLPKAIISVGDTASAARPREDGSIPMYQHGDQVFLWRCTGLHEHGAIWEEVEPWSEERAKAYIQAADAFIPIHL